MPVGVEDCHALSSRSTFSGEIRKGFREHGAREFPHLGTLGKGFTERRSVHDWSAVYRAAAFAAIDQPAIVSILSDARRPGQAPSSARAANPLLLYSRLVSAELIHEVIPVGLLQCNCSILGDRAAHEAIVVDPGDEVERILEILRRDHLTVRAIVSTHTHIDHVGGLAGLHRATGAPVLIHEEDLELYRHLDVQAQWLGVPTPAIARLEDFLKERDTIRWGGFRARILHTPGHTPGSISLVVERGTDTGDAQGS